MEKMYQSYKDVAEFYIVYISEAHAMDDRSPVGYAKELGIKEHKTYGERCSVADRLTKDKKLTIPCLIDGMDNAVEKHYKAWPDRIYLVRKDGKLAVAAKRGPWGFGPALKSTGKWLAAYKETGVEPDIAPEPEDATADYGALMGAMGAAYSAKNYKEAAAIAEEMLKIAPDDVGTMYNLACIRCLMGEENQAYAWLEKAIDGGYDDAKHLIADEDFKTIREQDRFKALVERTKKGAAGAKANDGKKIDAASIVGDWEMKTAFGGGSIDATMSLTLKEGKLTGLWLSQGEEMKLVDVALKGNKLSFKRVIPDGPELAFSGKIDGNKIAGKYTGGFGELDCSGKRKTP